MSDTGEVRWFRCGGARWAFAVTLVSLGVMLPLRLTIWGIATPGDGGVAIVGVPLILVCLAGAWGNLRSGLGVTPDHVLIRSGIGTTDVVPWSKVAGFEVRLKGSRTDGPVEVIGTDGQRWSTFGCVAEGSSALPATGAPPAPHKMLSFRFP